ncbi:unnamed protein product [Leuciscus chuanchicus]
MEESLSFNPAYLILHTAQTNPSSSLLSSVSGLVPPVPFLQHVGVDLFGEDANGRFGRSAGARSLDSCYAVMSAEVRVSVDGRMGGWRRGGWGLLVAMQADR